ncbi:MAG TPA: efflux RND transporter permease subunit, partial [Porticoccus sp.]|nr:efflux RND transporter permease subunit [Porticoccus sp.]
LQTVDERIKFRLQFQQPEQGKLDTLYGLTVINPAGEGILLRNLVELVTTPGESTIRHYFGRRNVTVYADIDKDQVSVAEINTTLSSYLEQENLRQRFSHLQILQGGEVKRQQQALGSVGNALILSLAGIVFLLVLLFNSITQPILVMMVIPLGIIGVLFAFALQGFDMSLSSMVGMVGLTGILVNDSLIMIDCLNRGREKDFLSEAEIVELASSRLRPIYITTITTAAALFPAAYELLGANPFLTPMIMAMLWGVIFGSLITLFYLPCLYAIEQDIRRWVGRNNETKPKPS